MKEKDHWMRTEMKAILEEVSLDDPVLKCEHAEYDPAFYRELVQSGVICNPRPGTKEESRAYTRRVQEEELPYRCAVNEEILLDYMRKNLV